MSPKMASIEEFYAIEWELTRPAPKREGINYEQAKQALAGDPKSFPIPDWVYGIEPKKKKKRRRRA